MKTKDKKNTKSEKTKDVKKVVPAEKEMKSEEEIKDIGTLSDGVLDAFEEPVVPVVDPLVVDPLLEEEALLEAEDDEDALDYNPAEW